MSFKILKKTGVILFSILLFSTLAFAQEDLPKPEKSDSEPVEEKQEVKDIVPTVLPSATDTVPSPVPSSSDILPSAVPSAKVEEKKIINAKPETTAPKKSPAKVVNKAPKKSPYALKPGKVYYKTHTVKLHENLYKIAIKYGMRYKTLAAMNNAKTPFLYTGQKVIIGKTLYPVGSIDGIIINIPEKKLYYFDGGKLINSYSVALGLPDVKWQTPVGDYKIVSMVQDPVWEVPVSIQKEMEKNGEEVKKIVPAGSENPLGKWWMGLTWTGLGIHSTNAPYSVGYLLSHGCIRMAPKTAEELFNLVKKNTLVKLAYQPVKISMDGKKKVYLEVYPNVYNKDINPVAIAKEMLVYYKLDKNIDWNKVKLEASLQSGKPVSINHDSFE